MRAELRRITLSNRFVKSATTDGRKSPIFMDDEVIGFGVQVRETGRKSFTLDYMFEGRRPRLFIGDFPDWLRNSARKHACSHPKPQRSPRYPIIGILLNAYVIRCLQ